MNIDPLPLTPYQIAELRLRIVEAVSRFTEADNVFSRAMLCEEFVFRGLEIASNQPC